MEYQSLAIMLIDSGKIAVVIGLLYYLIRKMLPIKYLEWIDERPFAVNIFIIFGSVGLSFLGAWLNAFIFKAKEMVEYIWFGLSSAGINCLGYEFIKNFAKEITRRNNSN